MCFTWKQNRSSIWNNCDSVNDYVIVQSDLTAQLFFMTWHTRQVVVHSALLWFSYPSPFCLSRPLSLSQTQHILYIDLHSSPSFHVPNVKHKELPFKNSTRLLFFLLLLLPHYVKAAPPCPTDPHPITQHHLSIFLLSLPSHSSLSLCE